MEFHHSRTMTGCGAGRRGHSIFGGTHPFLRPTLRSPGPERGSFLKCYAWGLSCPPSARGVFAQKLFSSVCRPEAQRDRTTLRTHPSWVVKTR